MQHASILRIDTIFIRASRHSFLDGKYDSVEKVRTHSKDFYMKSKIEQQQ